MNVGEDFTKKIIILYFGLTVVESIIKMSILDLYDPKF